LTIRVLVIGIGSGNADDLTQEAVRALNEVDMFLVPDKGAEKSELAELRRRLCAQVIDHHRYRVVEVPDPERGPDRARNAGDYRRAVIDWHERRVGLFAQAMREELPDGGVAGFLVWGDPAFYDSTLRILEQVRARADGEIDVRVVPGISSISMLAARHRVALNRVGTPIHITTGRRLLEEYRPELGDVVVMLDGHLACAGLVADYPDLHIYWGAQLGLPSETLVAGRLADVLGEIRDLRRRLRELHGWVMDIYLLRPGS
jgi:precorrin-6A synthase